MSPYRKLRQFRDYIPVELQFKEVDVRFNRRTLQFEDTLVEDAYNEYAFQSYYNITLIVMILAGLINFSTGEIDGSGDVEFCTKC